MSTSDIDVVSAHPPVQLRPTANAAVEMLRAHAEVMAIARDLATYLVRTTMVPNHYRSRVDDATAAILYGAELGLNPIQSLQQVAPVNGKPSIEARTMVALLKGRGYKFKTIEPGPTKVTVTGWWPGEEPESSTWTIERATAAEYVPQLDPRTGKYRLNSNNKLAGNMKYLTQPEEMLWAKAAATVCRRLAPDVLLGIAYSREDMESEPEHVPPVHATSERITHTDPVTAEPGGAGLPTTPWTDPDTFVGPPETPDTPAEADTSSAPVVSDIAPENPESDSSSAELDPWRAATPAEQTQLSELLDSHGHKSPAAKRAYLTAHTGRTIGSATDLKGIEAREITDRLTHTVTEEQLAALRTALANDHVHDEHEQTEWLQNNGAPNGFEDLPAALAEQLTDYLLDAQAGDSEPPS